MKINIYSISKNSRDDFYKIIENQTKMIQKYSQIKDFLVFNKKISLAQNRDTITAKESYSEAFYPRMKGFNIALDPNGVQMDSFEFSNFFDKIPIINFYIAGAFGFEEKFLNKCDAIVSLGKLTFSHKIAKTVLYEQIFRALTIINKHPYHK